MDPDIKALVKVVSELVNKVDGLLCHFSAIDADHVRSRDVLYDHEQRLSKLEKEHNLEPQDKTGEKSALFMAIKAPKPQET